jgi:GH24 family phage-related lysozyme (muramidase)
MASNKVRIGVASLALSAAGLVALVGEESYTSTAVIPVKGDVPTVGFGSTVREDGSKVQMGDSITPQKAVKRTMLHIQKDESTLKNCIRMPLTPGEYDILVKFSYQYGAYTTCKSGMVKNINAGKYAEACAVYLEYNKVAGRDCRIRENKCYGVITRNQARYDDCMAEQ